MGESGDMVYLLCPNYAKVLCDGIRNLYDKKDWADLVLSVNGHESMVHTFMISIFAPKLISHCEDNRCELHGINVDQQTLSTLLDFVYRGQIKVERERLKMLRKGAGKLGLKMLVDVIDKESRSAANLKRKTTNRKSVGKKVKVTEVEYVVQGELEESNVLDITAVSDADFKCPRCEFSTVELDAFKSHLSESHQLNSDDGRLRLKYKCGDCEFISADREDVSSHRQSEHNDKYQVNSSKKYKCSECDFMSDKKCSIRRHQRYTHSSEKPFKCSTDCCDYRGRTEKELQSHIEKQHDDVSYSCAHCDKSFVGKFSLNNHVKLSHTLPDQRHTCQFCDFKTRYMLDLKRHLSRQHNHRQHRIQKRKVFTDADLKPCPHCGVMLKTKPLLVDHLAYRHQVDLEGNSIQPNLKCKLCDYVCWAHFQLHNHVYQNHTEKKFRCEHCDYACRRRRALTAHVLGKHFGQKAFMCELCGQCFSYNATLRRHLLLHQSGTAFTCSVCGKIFSQKVYLDSHVRNAHTDTSSRHQCQMCTYSATTKGNLLKHVRRKHKNEQPEEQQVVVTDLELDVKSDGEVLIQEAVLEEIIIY